MKSVGLILVVLALIFTTGCFNEDENYVECTKTENVASTIYKYTVRAYHEGEYITKIASTGEVQNADNVDNVYTFYEKEYEFINGYTGVVFSLDKDKDSVNYNIDYDLTAMSAENYDDNLIYGINSSYTVDDFISAYVKNYYLCE